MIGGQTVALVMIVRNEAERIQACLEAARPLIDTWTIVDTGSDDETPRLVQECLDGIPGHLWHRPWVNFGHNRSQSLRKARGTAQWLLLLDADMQPEVDPGFVPDASMVDGYLIEMGGTLMSWRLPLLVRGDLPWISVGRVHAVTVLGNGRKFRAEPTDAIRLNRAESWSPAKSKLQAEILEEELARNPDDSRTVFYLAQTYRDMGHPGALAMYQRRVLMGGHPEEVFYSAYWGAMLLPEWGQRLQALLAAWELRPTRLEPLHAVIQGLNRLGMFFSAYTLSNVNVEPTSDVLFVHRSVWDWGMAFERAIAAHGAGQHAVAAALCADLLANPRLPAEEREAVAATLAEYEPNVAAVP